MEYGNAPPIGQWSTVAGALASPAAPANSSPVVEGAAGEAVTGGTAGVGGTAGLGEVAGTGGLAGGGGVGGAAGVGGTAGVTGKTAGTGATAGVGATAGTGGTSNLTMSFDVTTKPQGGKYAPRNVGAIWITTAAGQFVKTLEVWALVRASHLRKWNAEAAGSRVDAVSSATLSNHKTHHATWDLLDANGTPVPDGSYKVIIELTDQNSAGQFTSVDFVKGPMPSTVTAPDHPYFTGMQVVLQ